MTRRDFQSLIEVVAGVHELPGCPKSSSLRLPDSSGLPKNNRPYMQFVVDKDLRETLYTN
jgi:hypothetical protein